MKKTQKCTKLNNSETYLNLKNFSFRYLNFRHFAKDALLFDIETTGLSPDTAYVYLIGAAYQKDSEFVTEQFFAENTEDEAALLREFSALAQRFRTFITFNGNRFDLPFLYRRQEILYHNINYVNIQDTIRPNINHIDLYKLFTSYKHILNLENYKQKTLEKFLNIKREDSCDGKQLIKCYHSYQKTQEPELLHILLQHNYEDLMGMAKLLSLCTIDGFFHGDFIPVSCDCSSYSKLNGTAGQELTVFCRLANPLPASFSCSNAHYYLHCSAAEARFRIPLYEGSLKYFYPNYKEYYYLPDEDTAIHKSVAAYVDKAHRKKATAATCYTKKAGLFLPQYEEVFTPAFFTEYKEKICYFELPDTAFSNLKSVQTESFEKTEHRNAEYWKKYCMHILHILKSGK